MIKISPNVIIVLLITFQIGFSQESKSIHQIEWEKHNNDVIVMKKQESANSIIPLNKEIFEQKILSNYVFGYLPDWEYNNYAPRYFQWDLMTHMAFFDFEVNPSTGAISNPSNWPWTALIDTAHVHGIKVIMCVVKFNNNDIHTIITNPTVKNNFFEKVKAKIETNNLDGINIDFEGLHSSDRSNNINPFMAELTDYVHTNIGSDKEVSFAGPAVNWGGWNFPGLAAACDYIFIMGYSFWYNGSSTAGPSAPLVGGNFNITNTLTNTNNGYGAVVNNNPEKLILGVPYYGNKWRTNSQNEGSHTLADGESRTYATAKLELGYRDLLWSLNYKTPWYTYETGGNYYQTWFDNDSSLGLKYDLARSKNLKGIGMWALGYDDHHPELWNLLRSSFLDTTDENGQPDKFKLYQNYPNPFNPNTAIEYEIIEADNIELSIYNILGEQVAVLVNEMQQPGVYKVKFGVETLHARSLPSGTYLYQLKTGSYSKVKKMILIK
jgi:spore germination protein YaaH